MDTLIGAHPLVEPRYLLNNLFTQALCLRFPLNSANSTGETDK
jgi:hypothetical protein